MPHVHQDSILAPYEGKGLQIIIPKRQSREVEWLDIFQVLRDGARIKLAMLKPFPGKWPRASSISHCQIEAFDPLRFFVVDKYGIDKLKRFFGCRTVINPKIVWHGESVKRHQEGCMSFPFTRQAQVRRWNIIELEYLTPWRLVLKMKPLRRKFYEFRAWMCQHELDHMDNQGLVHKLLDKKKDL